MKLMHPTVSAPLSWAFVVLAGSVLAGCATKATMIAPDQRRTVDRALVEYPPGLRLQTVVRNLRSPTAIAFDQEGSLIVADEGLSEEPHIFGFKLDGSSFEVYPRDHKFFGKGAIRGPVGGMAAAHGRVYILHSNDAGRGVITAIDYKGTTETIVGDLPAEGEHGILDLVLNRFDGRLYFSIGSTTNSGVVGLDNWQQGWVDRHELACDVPAVPYKLLGYRFDTPNPRAGLFGGSDIAVTGPFQPFGKSQTTWIQLPANAKATAAVYSVSVTGGDMRLEAHGVRCARGLAFNDFGRLYATNQGMELRGTRPVRDDPDSLIRIIRNTWYGWPDFSADLQPVTEARFQPPGEMIIKTGYPELANLVDQQASGLLRPDRATLLQAVFQPLSGAAKMDFVPTGGPLRSYYGSVIVALSGDKAPFATSGYPLVAPVGYKVVQVDVDNHTARDFVFNTKSTRDTGKNQDALHRPFDVKFGPDGSMYVLDIGRLDVKGAKIVPVGRSGKIMRMDAQ